jgi:hypothetical protein
MSDLSQSERSPERQLSDAADHVFELIAHRGHSRSEIDGTSDEDLLGAVEELERTIAAWRQEASRA